MKIRITGTKEELDLFIQELKKHFDVISISSFYANTRKVIESKEGRIYIEVRLKDI